MDDVLVVVAFHSGHGHTARQAAAVAEGAGGTPGARAELVDVSEVDDAGWALLDAADAIVFGSPTHMGTRSAVFQAFAEATAGIWAQGRWRDKLAAGFTNSAGVNGDKLATLTSLVVFAAQHGMTWVPLGLPPGWLFTANGSPTDLNRLGGFLGALAQSPSDVGPEHAPPDSDLRTAAHLGGRVALAARRVAAGRALVGA
ncbi:flavodoxin family protein [Actinokineospora sp. G85]|uniref:flavodoxin family protein n=1 Tax=Actinokineospora sp. G85 TaxID=3406626 RepID=UPI003C75A5D1